MMTSGVHNGHIIIINMTTEGGRLDCDWVVKKSTISIKGSRELVDLEYENDKIDKLPDKKGAQEENRC